MTSRTRNHSRQSGPPSTESGYPGWVAPLGVVLVAVVPALGLLGHQFVFDSLTIIRDNPAVHSLAAPWQFFAREYWPPPYTGLYRPLSILLFALEWALGRGSPAVFHAGSVVLYAALSLAVYRLARLLLPRVAAVAAALLFAAHPLHTEAVASAVNQSELLVALLLTLATIRYLTARRTADGTPGPRDTLIILALYILAILAKESGIVLPGLLVAAELTVVGAGEGIRRRLARVRPLYLAMVLTALVLIAVRGMVLGGDVVGTFTAESLAGQSLGGRALTMLSVVPEWFRLLFWPAHLQTEYAPREISPAMGWGQAQTRGVLLLALAALVTLRFRHRRPEASLGLLWIAVALVPVHNVLVPTGVILAERTLLLATVGAVILAGAAVAWASDPERSSRTHALAAGVLTAVSALGLWRTANRYPVWRDQVTLFDSMVTDAPLSYKAHFGLADLLAQQGRRAEAEAEYRRAIDLYPPAVRVYQALGDLYRRAGLCDPAIDTYTAGLAQSSSPDFDNVRRSLIACLAYEGRYREAAAQARIGIAGGRDPVNFRRFLAAARRARAAGAPAGTVRLTME